jgi:hypothetical protein
MTTMPTDPPAATHLGSGFHWRPSTLPTSPSPAAAAAASLALRPEAAAPAPPLADGPASRCERLPPRESAGSGSTAPCARREQARVLRMSEMATPARQHAAGARTSMRRTITPEK